MQRIKESFREVVAGTPTKKHYLNVSIIILLISTAIALFITFYQIGK